MDHAGVPGWFNEHWLPRLPTQRDCPNSAVGFGEAEKEKVMNEGIQCDSTADLNLCDGCHKPISGSYATFGGNFVPYIAPKAYHLGCLPSLRSADPDPTFVHGSLTDAKFECTLKRPPLWTATERGHLMYCGWVVADMRYANARGRVPFILAALNAAEEKL
jgi:hypothetical protein